MTLELLGGLLVASVLLAGGLVAVGALRERRSKALLARRAGEARLAARLATLALPAGPLAQSVPTTQRGIGPQSALPLEMIAAEPRSARAVPLDLLPPPVASGAASSWPTPRPTPRPTVPVSVDPVTPRPTTASGGSRRLGHDLHVVDPRRRLWRDTAAVLLAASVLLLVVGSLLPGGILPAAAPGEGVLGERAAPGLPGARPPGALLPVVTLPGAPSGAAASARAAAASSPSGGGGPAAAPAPGDRPAAATPHPARSASPSAAPSSGPSGSPAGPSSSATPSATPGGTASASPLPSATPAPTSTLLPSATPAPTSTPVPPTDSPTPVPTASPASPLPS